MVLRELAVSVFMRYKTFLLFIGSQKDVRVKALSRRVESVIVPVWAKKRGNWQAAISKEGWPSPDHETEECSQERVELKDGKENEGLGRSAARRAPPTLLRAPSL
jgi:hypothetical protein